MNLDALFGIGLYLGVSSFYLLQLIIRRQETRVLKVIVNANRFYLKYRSVQGLSKNLKKVKV